MDGIYIEHTVKSAHNGTAEGFVEEISANWDHAVHEGYGGMDAKTYDGIYDYIKSKAFPHFVIVNDDRNARFHWKLKCLKYEIVHEHLVYVNNNVKDTFKKRFVVRSGEVLPLLTAIHDKIGHLGMKRTQAAVYQCFYWRSVRSDVQRFVNACDYCNRKKLCGKKVLKAPIDVFDSALDVKVHPDVRVGAHRFVISLRGVPDSISLSRRLNLSTYTFSAKQRELYSGRNDVSCAFPSVGGRILSGHIRQLPFGHSLDGFHEIHCNLASNDITMSSSPKSFLIGNWFSELDTCRKIRGRKRVLNSQCSADQTSTSLSARDGENLLNISPSAVVDGDECEIAITAPEKITSFKHNMFPADFRNSGIINDLYDKKASLLRLCSGFATRYVEEKFLNRDAPRRELEKEDCRKNGELITYEFSTEYWHLPPTFSNVM